MKRLSTLGAALLLAGCANVVMNDGSTVVIEWDSTASGREEAIEVATKSCREAGKQTAQEVNEVSTNPNLPAWFTTRRLTFKCQ
jgi:hypothetical protein